MRKGLYILLIAICSLQFVAKAQQEELKPWIDVVMDERDPSQWKVFLIHQRFLHKIR